MLTVILKSKKKIKIDVHYLYILRYFCPNLRNYGKENKREKLNVSD